MAVTSRRLGGAAIQNPAYRPAGIYSFQLFADLSSGGDTYSSRVRISLERPRLGRSAARRRPPPSVLL